MTDGVISVRPAHIADADVLHRLFETTRDDADEKVVRYRERLASLIAGETHRIHVVTLDGEIVGYAAAQDYGPALDRDYSVARMHDIWVSPDARGRGAGTALFESIRDWIVSETRIRFLEWHSNDEAIGFYHRLGLGDGDDSAYEIEFPMDGR